MHNRVTRRGEHSRTLPSKTVGVKPESTSLGHNGKSLLLAALVKWELKNDYPQPLPWRKRMKAECK